jgi:hypothetical protein
MTPDDLRRWQAEMGYTYDTAARALGVGRRTYAAWIASTARIPAPVDLACAALIDHLEPYSARG